MTEGALPTEDLPEVEISDTREPSHGDYACNFALVAAKKAGKNPRELAQLLASHLEAPSPQVGEGTLVP